MPRFHLHTLLTCMLALTCAARADVGPPVEIKMLPDAVRAVTGQEYAGEFLLHVHRPGTITKLTVAGEGWRVLQVDLPAQPLAAQAGTVRIPFRAIPDDANQPLALSLRFNGRPARQQYFLGPQERARRAQPRVLARLEDAVLPQAPPEAANGKPVGRTTSGAGLRASTIRVTGRIAYLRMDGLVVGADEIDVRVIDNDPVGSEEMWSGFTNELGYFDTGVIDADVDTDGSGPDLIIYVETERPGWVDVTDNSITEDTYFWQTAEIEDYEGAEKHYGTLLPVDANQHPAMHIYNSIVRARRYLLEKPGIGVPEVQVEWPDDSKGNAAWYEDGSNEIHISTGRQWREDTHTHEFGHHDVDSAYVNDPLEPDYCNAWCDANDPVSMCGGGGGTGCGHCIWCPETDHDAFNEGFPNWMADVITRDYELRYTLDVGGPPYQPLNFRDQENLQPCCDGQYQDRFLTEGFIGALLRDIEDAGQDDHDDDPDPNDASFDGILDSMCVGPNPIFFIVSNYEPITVVDFLNAFRAEFPQMQDELWPTAFNVGGAGYVAGWPSDSTPPGVVPGADSPTHPIGTGGTLPCVTLEFDPAPDDVTGASNYSFAVTTSPAGVLPPDDAWPSIGGSANCRLSAKVPMFDLGTYYISVRAQDNAGNWSNSFSVFGPFEVLDCNGTGILDICDIGCSREGIPGCLVADLCTGQPGCGLSSDCNGNFKPDECDIASGESDDCDQDGIPDECETTTLKHWSGGDPVHPTWFELGTNWAEGAPPAAGHDACLFSGPSPLLRRDAFTLGTLACGLDLTMAQAAGLPSVTLTLLNPSFLFGNLTQSSGTILVNDELTISGQFTHSGGTLHGFGRTTVLGGHTLSGTCVINNHTLNLECDTTASGAFSGFNFDIRNFSGFTYNHNGTGVTVADGSSGSQFINEGVFVKSGGAGTLRFGLPVDNSGLIRAEVGTLNLNALTCTGDVLGLPGTTLQFSGTANFEPDSSLVGDLIWPRASGGVLNVGGTYQAANTTVGVLGEFPVVNFLPGANVLDYGANFVVASGLANFRTVHGAPIQLNHVSISGQADFDSGDPVVIQTLTLGGQIRGDSEMFTINGLFTWKPVGTFFDPGEVHANGGIMIEASSSERTCARILYNSATATFLGAIGTAGSGRFHNLPTGTALLQGDFTGVTGGRITNEGTVLKTAGTGRSTLAQLTNSGLVHAQTGEMYFYFGGTNNGEIRGDPGTLLTFNSAHEMSTGSTLIADDIKFFLGGTSNIRGAVNISDTLTNEGGVTVFTNEAVVTSYGQHLQLVSGTVQYQAPTVAPTLALDTVSLNGAVHFLTGQPVDIETLTLTTGSIQGPSTITVNDSFAFHSGTITAGGLMTASGPVSINSIGGTRNLQRNFDNADVMTFVNGGLQLSNATLHNLSTGTIDIRTTGSAFALTTTSTLQNDGLLVKSAGAGVSTISNHFRNTGTVDVRVGTLQFTGTNGLTHIQTAGQTILNGGHLAVTAPGTYQVQGGELRGNGTITGGVVNSGGAVLPGLSAGMLAIVGNYTQQPPGSLRVELGGLAPGQFDALTVSGTATLGGELNIQRINGYAQSVGDTFVILTAGTRTGTFASVTGVSGFDVSYTPTQVILTATAPALTGDVDGDCDVDLDDMLLVLGNLGCAGGGCGGDAEGDGDSDLDDLLLVLGSFGDACP